MPGASDRRKVAGHPTVKSEFWRYADLPIHRWLRSWRTAVSGRAIQSGIFSDNQSKNNNVHGGRGLRQMLLCGRVFDCGRIWNSGQSDERVRCYKLLWVGSLTMVHVLFSDVYRVVGPSQLFSPPCRTRRAGSIDFLAVDKISRIWKPQPRFSVVAGKRYAVCQFESCRRLPFRANAEQVGNFLPNACWPRRPTRPSAVEAPTLLEALGEIGASLDEMF